MSAANGLCLTHNAVHPDGGDLREALALARATILHDTDEPTSGPGGRNKRPLTARQRFAKSQARRERAVGFGPRKKKRREVHPNSAAARAGLPLGALRKQAAQK